VLSVQLGIESARTSRFIPLTSDGMSSKMYVGLSFLSVSGDGSPRIRMPAGRLGLWPKRGCNCRFMRGEVNRI